MGHDVRENWYGFYLNKYKDVECIYALYDNKGNLLYIGETIDFKTRMIPHLSYSPFKDMIDKIVFYETDIHQRKEIEFILIDICKPIFNNQNQDLEMRRRKHVIERDYDAPPYNCRCRACRPDLHDPLPTPNFLTPEEFRARRRKRIVKYKLKNELEETEKNQINLDL